MKPISGTRVKYFFICHRKLWLFDRDIWMEHTSGAVQEGELLHKTAYPKRAARFRELEINGSRIDAYDPQDNVVHELKRSPAMIKSDTAQLKFYLYLLESFGIIGATGILEYPKQRQTEAIILTDSDREDIKKWEKDIETLTLATADCPPVINKTFCKKCAYYEFCYVTE